jgi:hypothetical protein
MRKAEHHLAAERKGSRHPSVLTDGDTARTIAAFVRLA